MKLFLLIILLNIRCDFFDSRKPWISTYVAETGVPAITR